MSNPSGDPVRVEITEILAGGVCPLELKAGQVWEVRDGFLPEGMCAAAWNSIQPYVIALRYGGTMPWSGERLIDVCCPDAANPVVFRLTVLDR
jgi:uncharacterized repeat protein (TIGR04076 family)